MHDIHDEIGRLQDTMNELVGRWMSIEECVRTGRSADPRRDGWMALQLRSKTARVRAMREELEARIARGRINEPLPPWWSDI